MRVRGICGCRFCAAGDGGTVARARHTACSRLHSGRQGLQRGGCTVLLHFCQHWWAGVHGDPVGAVADGTHVLLVRFVS